LIWIFIQESRYGDTITYSLKRHIKAIEDIKEFLKLKTKMEKAVEDFDELIGLLKYYGI